MAVVYELVRSRVRSGAEEEMLLLLREPLTDGGDHPGPQRGPGGAARPM